MFAFAAPRARRKPSLTPMIDVVFLLLVFFMLAARFGVENGLSLQTAGAGQAEYSGPPRLLDITHDGLLLNGTAMSVDAAIAKLPDLMESPEDIIVLRPRDGADLQSLVAVMSPLSKAGFTGLVLVEGAE